MKTLEVTLPRSMKFEGANKNTYNLSLHVQFHYLQYGLVKAADQTKLKIPVSVMNTWDTTIKSETKLVEESAKSEHTAELLAKDTERDNLLANIFYVIRGHRFSPTASVREAALRLEAKLKPYANLRNRPFEMESAGIRGLEDDMTTMTADITAVGLTDAFARLHVANEEYEKLRIERRSDAAGAKLPGSKKVRPLADAAYDLVCQYIQAAYLYATTDEDKAMIELLVDNMNKVVVDIKGTQHSILAQRKPKDPNAPKKPKDPKAPKEPKDPKPQPDPKPTPKPGDDDGDDVYIPKD